MTEAVSIVTIKNKIPLFKKEEQANSIELIELEEVGNTLVAQKDLYQIGDKAIFIQPDFNLPDNSLFESFYRPGGDPKKCLLGSNGRIKAKKFNLHIGNGLPVYSYGILIPLNEILQFLDYSQFINDLEALKTINFTEELRITKWEEPEDKNNSGIKGDQSRPFPEDMYKTDEENINNLWNNIKYPITLIGTEKIDGSSITLYYKNGKAGICSRNLDKPLIITRVKGIRNKTLLEKLMFWTKPDLKIYEEVESDSDFVRIGKPYLDIFADYCKNNNYSLVLRGELNGKGLKGSGNKNNPSINSEPNILFYGMDYYNTTTIKAPESDFDLVLFSLNNEDTIPKFNRCKIVFNKTFNSKEELLNECNNYFKDNMIEGIVVRTLDSNFSSKIMNLAYDEKK